MSENSTQLVVIGAGPGGYTAAFYAADKGMDVTLIDPEENPGGVCLYRGCIPSKALLHVAKLVRETQEAKNWGLDFGKPKTDIDKLRSWKDGVVKRLTGGVGQLAKSRKVNYVRGTATFKNNKTLNVKDIDNKTSELNFEKAIIATGSRPAAIPNLPDSDRILDSTKALNLPEVPEKLLVVGGGYIGLEMGTVYSALGSQVTVVEMLPGILPGADRDLVRTLQKTLQKQFHEILLETKVANMKETKSGLNVTLEGENIDEPERTFDKAIISVGRKPNSANLGLENTAIETSERGFIKINGPRQTAEENIYAIGDVAGEPMLAHKASHEGITAVEAIRGGKVSFEPAAIPAVVFTDPEVAWAGLTENEAKERGIEVDIARFQWGASGRALTMDRPDGVTKLLTEPETNRILGVALVGAGAGELISEGALAIEMAANATDLKLTIHPHPTLTETVMEAAEMIFGTSTHVYRPKRKK